MKFCRQLEQFVDI